MMATVFSDDKDFLLVEFVERGTTVTAAMYSETLT